MLFCLHRRAANAPSGLVGSALSSRLMRSGGIIQGWFPHERMCRQPEVRRESKLVQQPFAAGCCAGFVTPYSPSSSCLWGAPIGLLTLGINLHSRSTIELLGMLPLAGRCLHRCSRHLEFERGQFLASGAEWPGVQCVRNDDGARSRQSRQISNHRAPDRRHGGKHRGLRIRLCTEVAPTSRRRMAAGSAGVVSIGFAAGVSWFLPRLDQAGAESLRADIQLAGRLLRFQRALHAGNGLGLSSAPGFDSSRPLADCLIPRFASFETNLKSPPRWG